MALCVQCGAEVAGDATVCSSCSTPIQEAPEAEAPSWTPSWEASSAPEVRPPEPEPAPPGSWTPSSLRASETPQVPTEPAPSGRAWGAPAPPPAPSPPWPPSLSGPAPAPLPPPPALPPPPVQFPPGVRVPDYTPVAVMATIGSAISCGCCLPAGMFGMPLGIASLVYATQATSYAAAGLTSEAQKAAGTARILLIVLGVLVGAALLLGGGVIVAAVLTELINESAR